MSACKVKAFELRDKSTEELLAQLSDLKTELASLRVQKVASGSAQKLAMIRHVRRAIARVNTVITLKEREAAKQAYAGAKLLPKDLRAKTTRAMRRRLTKDEASRRTARQIRKALTSKPLKYAVKAA